MRLKLEIMSLLVVMLTPFFARAEDRFAVGLRFPFSPTSESSKAKCGHAATFQDLKAGDEREAISEGESLLGKAFKGSIKCCYAYKHEDTDPKRSKCTIERTHENPKIIGVDVLKVLWKGRDSASYEPICRLGASHTSIDDCK